MDGLQPQASISKCLHFQVLLNFEFRSTFSFNYFALSIITLHKITGFSQNIPFYAKNILLLRCYLPDLLCVVYL